VSKVKEKNLPRKMLIKLGVTVDIEKVFYYVGRRTYRVGYRRSSDERLIGCLAVARGDVFEETDWKEWRTFPPVETH